MKRFNVQQINNSQTMTLIMVHKVIITSDMIDGVIFGNFVMRHGLMTDELQRGRKISMRMNSIFGKLCMLLFAWFTVTIVGSKSSIGSERTPAADRFKNVPLRIWNAVSREYVLFARKVFFRHITTMMMSTSMSHFLVDRSCHKIQYFPTFVERNDGMTAPKVFRNLMQSWKCMKDQSWTIHALNSRFGSNLFSCGMNVQHEDDPVLMTLQEYIASHCQGKNQISSVDPKQWFDVPYIFDPAFDFDCSELLDEYTIPSIFKDGDLLDTLPPDYKPDFRWLLIGGAGSGSRMHVDPCFTSAWNAVVSGTKLWLLIDPRLDLQAPSLRNAPQAAFKQAVINQLPLLEQLDGPDEMIEERLLANIHSEVVNCICKTQGNMSADSLVTIIAQREAELLYVPAGWKHAVLNLTPSVAITHNFLEPAHASNFLRSYRHSVGDKFDALEWQDIDNLIQRPVKRALLT